MNAKKSRSIEKIVSIIVGAAVFLTVYFFIRDARSAEPHQILSGVIRVNTGVCDMDATARYPQAQKKRPILEIAI